MRSLRSLTEIIDAKSVVLSLLAVASTWLCVRFGISTDLPMTLIATAIVFPLVFSIGQAYRRREKSLEEYAIIKAHGRALYLAARDWLPHADEARTDAVRTIMGELLRSCRTMFASPFAQMQEHERRIYGYFSSLSRVVEMLRAQGLSGTECSRCNQYLSRIMTSFENMKHIYAYRTPRTLRSFSDLFILLLPLLYAPYFAFEVQKNSGHAAYLVPVLFTVTLVGLSNIQQRLENPFDQIGEDDVTINADKFVRSLAEGD